MNENITMTEETKKENIRMNESDILASLIAAASYKYDEEDAVEIKIKRKGKDIISFKVRPLSDEEYQDCKKSCTTYKKNKQLGTKVAESVNVAAYRSSVIYTATVNKDREKIWDNKAAWNKLGIATGRDLVDVVLKAGEKDMILDKIEEISGFQPNVEETVKN